MTLARKCDEERDRWHGLGKRPAGPGAPCHARAPSRLERRGTPLNHRNLAVRGVEAAAIAAGLGKVTPKDLRASFCSLAGRRRVDPVEAAQLTGHSLNVWTRQYARSFGKAQRDEARDRMLEHGFGELVEVDQSQ